MAIRRIKKGRIVNNTKNDADNKEEKIKIKGFDSEPTSLLEAIERVGLVASENEYSEEGLSAIDTELKYLAKRLGTTTQQAFLLGVCIENDFTQMTVSDIAQFLGITNARAISLVSDLSMLVHLRLLSVNSRFGGDTYKVPNNILKMLSRNEDYKAPKVTDLDSRQLLAHFNTLIGNTRGHKITTEELEEEVKWVLEANPKCRLVKVLNKLNLHVFNSYFTLLMLCAARCSRGIEKLEIRAILQYLDDQVEAHELKFDLMDEDHELFDKGLIEHWCEDGVANSEVITLTAKGRKQLLAGMKPGKNHDTDSDDELIDSNCLKLIEVADITPKVLFYDSEVGTLVSDLNKFFEEDNYSAIVERMKERNFRSAFTCLFYGGPGTGKTETVNQLARLTGRDILLVDVPQIKDKWIGESEKNVKAIFDAYRALAKKSKLTPILLFNEADSIFAKRLTNVQQSADQMLNTMQNIILQEMETLDGILIATTNLTDNLDKAFERRFLYKIKFERPGVEAREHIWQAMIPTLNNEQAATLAEAYEFSGGQIENVARKHAIDSILHGDATNLLDTISSFCDNELIEGDSNHRRVGF